MISKELEKRERDFNEWMDSIRFVDKDGNLIPSVLTKDNSEDPEGDKE